MTAVCGRANSSWVSAAPWGATMASAAPKRDAACARPCRRRGAPLAHRHIRQRCQQSPQPRLLPRHELPTLPHLAPNVQHAHAAAAAAAAEEVGRAPPQLLPQQQPVRQVEAATARKAVGGAAAPASGRRRPNCAPKKVGRSARRLLDALLRVHIVEHGGTRQSEQPRRLAHQPV